MTGLATHGATPCLITKVMNVVNIRHMTLLFHTYSCKLYCELSLYRVMVKIITGQCPQQFLFYLRGIAQI